MCSQEVPASELQLGSDFVAQLLDRAGLQYEMKKQVLDVDTVSFRLPGGLRIWVYDLGMQVVRDALDQRLEIEDFASFEEMRSRFAGELEAAIGPEFLGRTG